MHVSALERRNTPRKESPEPAVRETAERVVCTTCGEAEGFLFETDGAVYRVLEDSRDTDLLVESGGIEAAFVTCRACKTTMRAESLLASQEVEYGEDLLVSRPLPRIRMGPRRNRIHPAGKASRRETQDGRSLPMCPECGATHEFFVDLEGAAYRVLEDDQDTDLLNEAANLLCSRCHAVFEL